MENGWVAQQFTKANLKACHALRRTDKTRIKGLQMTVAKIVTFLVAISLSYSCDRQSLYSNHLNKKSIADGTGYPGFCTILCISKGESVFFGNNEDWRNPNTFYWVQPPSDSTYGALYLGYEDLFPQGGINEKGLAFDANSIPGIKLKEHRELLKPYQAIVNTYIMQKCATVEEAIEMAKSYDWSQSFGGTLRGQFLLADATGDAVVISADQNGEIAFTRKQKGDGYIVSTNFNRAYPENKFGSGKCWRYETATKMLSNLITQDSISTELIVRILDAVHEEGNDINTVYSNVFDLKDGLVYLYHWHQFDQVVSMKVSDLIGLNPGPQRIESLFSEEAVNKADTEYSRFKNRNRIVYAIVVLTAIAFVVLIWLRNKRVAIRRGVI